MDGRPSDGSTRTTRPPGTPSVDLLQATEDGQQGAFAAAGGSGDQGQLTGVDIQVQVVQHLGAHVAGDECLADTDGAKCRLIRSRRGCPVMHGRYLNSVAGSARRRLRMAASPETAARPITSRMHASAAGTFSITGTSWLCASSISAMPSTPAPSRPRAPTQKACSSTTRRSAATPTPSALSVAYSRTEPFTAAIRV